MRRGLTKREEACMRTAFLKTRVLVSGLDGRGTHFQTLLFGTVPW